MLCLYYFLPNKRCYHNVHSCRKYDTDNFSHKNFNLYSGKVISNHAMKGKFIYIHRQELFYTNGVTNLFILYYQGYFFILQKFFNNNAFQNMICNYSSASRRNVGKQPFQKHTSWHCCYENESIFCHLINIFSVFRMSVKFSSRKQ